MIAICLGAMLLMSNESVFCFRFHYAMTPLAVYLINCVCAIKYSWLEKVVSDIFILVLLTSCKWRLVVELGKRALRAIHTCLSHISILTNNKLQSIHYIVCEWQNQIEMKGFHCF